MEKIEVSLGKRQLAQNPTEHLKIGCGKAEERMEEWKGIVKQNQQ